MKGVKLMLVIWSVLAILSIVNSFVFAMPLFVKIVSWIFGALNIFAMIGFIGLNKQEKQRESYVKGN